MSSEAFLLSLIAMAIAIPVTIGVSADMFKRWLSFKERQMDRIAEMADRRAARGGARIDELEQRIRVLERIATDSGAVLAAEIDQLRIPERSAAGRLIS